MDELDALGEDLAMEAATGESGSVPSYMQVIVDHYVHLIL